jgi:hypothetical protein
MKQSTIRALFQAYNSLHIIIDELYEQFEKAVENEDYGDASLLEARADRLFSEAEAILAVILEYQNG